MSHRPAPRRIPPRTHRRVGAQFPDDPVPVGADPGVHAGKVLVGAAVSPADDADEDVVFAASGSGGVPPAPLDNQGPAGVAPAAVPPGRRRAQHVVGDVPSVLPRPAVDLPHRRLADGVGDVVDDGGPACPAGS